MVVARTYVAALWSLVFVIWLIVARNNHPTFALNFVSTFILVISSAASFRVWRTGFRGRSAAARVILRTISTVALGTLAAVVIHLVYDAIRGPDPLRFSFVSNVAMDTAFVAIHTLPAWLVCSLWKRAATLRGTGEKSADAGQ